jgi:S-adenosylmethionine hydrolase
LKDHRTIIAITTDLGTKDYYLAALKGTILKRCSEVQWVDVNCHIKPFDIRQAAFHLQGVFPYFPENTIHLAHILPGFEKARILFLSYHGQYVVTFDNGLVSLLPNEFLKEVYALKPELVQKTDLFFSQSIALVVNHLAAQKPLREIGDIITDYQQKKMPQPTISQSGLKGMVVAIDGFGNVITNIHKSIFEDFVGNKRFQIAIHHVRIKEISTDYKSVVEGDLLALFNSNGYLEIAIRQGKASSLLGIEVDNAVWVMLQ